MEYFVLASETKPRTKIYLTTKKKKKKKKKIPGAYLPSPWVIKRQSIKNTSKERDQTKPRYSGCATERFRKTTRHTSISFTPFGPHHS